MEIEAICDLGLDKIDRYTIVPDWGKSSKGWPIPVLMTGDDPSAYSQWGVSKEGEYLGKTISFAALPVIAQEHINERLKE